MRLRIKDIDHFIGTLAETDEKIVYADDHSGLFGTYYYIWFKSGTDVIEIKVNNLSTLLAVITEISNMKKEVRTVTWMNSRSY